MEIIDGIVEACCYTIGAVVAGPSDNALLAWIMPFWQPSQICFRMHFVPRNYRSILYNVQVNWRADSYTH